MKLKIHYMRHHSEAEIVEQDVDMGALKNVSLRRTKVGCKPKAGTIL